MTTIFGLENYRTPAPGPVLTIGNFDGVHLGHLALFDRATSRAREVDGTSMVLTFEPHPMRVLRPDVNLPQICVLERKLELIGQAGIEVIIVARFSADFAAITARDFVRKILVNRLGIKELVVGHDYTFGRGRQGDIGLLNDMGRELGFAVHEVGPVEIEGQVVSSTRVRSLILDGDIPAANRLLGREYQLSGRVIQGHGRGAKLLGFPTANLRPANELLPPIGVYAVLVERGDVTHQGVTNIGTNPTFGNGELSVETHILDFQGDLHDQTIRLRFFKRLRGQRRFGGIDELASQIGLDVLEARRVLEDSYITAKK
ncbi:MAG: bifunctional riboflavin kinase/FAD synthetase [Proteobacteria bacterium]|nr:bifunctional riboflavin kinase/FAD synthetase [Pseudomonadota bacterium]